MDPIMFFIFLVRANTHGHRWVLQNSDGATRKGLQKGMAPSHVTPLAALIAQEGISTIAVKKSEGNTAKCHFDTSLYRQSCSTEHRMQVLSLPCICFKF